MTRFWAEFAVLYAAALVGAAALTPYAARLISASARPRKVSVRTLLIAAFAQSAVLFGVVVAVGLVAAHAVGLGAPYVEALVSGRPPPGSPGAAFGWALVLGAAAGLALLIADLAMLPRLPALLALARKSTLAENFLASFYGGANEELLTRLLGVSGVAWLLAQIWRAADGRPTDAAMWTAILIMAVLFSLGHLPAARAVAGRLTPLILARTLALNVPVAVICGWLFWRFGIEAAIVAHFTVDIVYHVGGTALLRANDHARFLAWLPPPADAQG